MSEEDFFVDTAIMKLEEYKDIKEEIKGLKKELELYKDNQIHLINQLEQKERIIIEVRDYINNSVGMEFVNNYSFPTKPIIDKVAKKELLKILDKVEESKNESNRFIK